MSIQKVHNLCITLLYIYPILYYTYNKYMQYIRTSKIMRVGTSLSIVIPVEILRALKMERGDQVVFGVYDDNTIIIKKIPDNELRNFQKDINI